MAKLSATYTEEFVQQAVAQIPWGHNTILLDKISDDAEREWYIEKVIENNWSRNVLVHQIESKLYERQALVSKVSNFEKLLPSAQSELALQTMKDPYVFDFIPFKEDMVERDIENAQIKKPEDNATIGLLLCKSKNNLVAEYSLRDMSKPMGISEYKISGELPEELKAQLPSIEDIQSRIK